MKHKNERSLSESRPQHSPDNAIKGGALEHLIFGNRLWIVAVCALFTLLMAYQATELKLNASFEQMIPSDHPYILNYLETKDDVYGLGNSVRITVANNKGTIFDKEYLATLKAISDEVFLLPGTDRMGVKSLWTPNTRWMGVTEVGLEGGPVIPNDYDGSERSIQELRKNIERSNLIGHMVGFDRSSSVIFLPLADRSPQTGEPLDYDEFAGLLEDIRSKYGSESVAIHITGFAKIIGDLMDGLRSILLFFLASVLIAGIVLFWYSRCVRSTLAVLGCSLVAVVWQLGLLPTLGYSLDPYSILVPFLVFAIGMSHGAQKMSGIMQDTSLGATRLDAAQLTFRRLFKPGLTAILSDALGFLVLVVIGITAIQNLAVTASIGVAVLILTQLILLPILMSYMGVGKAACERVRRRSQLELSGGGSKGFWYRLSKLTLRRSAVMVVSAHLVVGAGAYIIGQDVQVGDVHEGAPELRADSRYNQDVAYENEHYGAGTDIFAVLVRAPDGACSNYDTLMKMDALEWRLRALPSVDSTASLSGMARHVLAGLSEGHPKWLDLLANQSMLNFVTANAPRELYNIQCNTMPVLAYLNDHRAGTLNEVSAVAQAFAEENNTEDVQFLLAAGTAGIQAATNEVVEKADRVMLVLVYAAVILLSLVTFRSWRAVVCAIIPLIFVSIVCKALMVGLGIGVKVATLPVIALGVGVGIDYALYVMSALIAQLRVGASLQQAYYRSLLATGRVVLLTGVMMAIAVSTWFISPIKFQADMGILLAFMFLGNMICCLVLLPALSYFLMSKHVVKGSSPEGSYGEKIEVQSSRLCEKLAASAV